MKVTMRFTVKGSGICNDCGKIMLHCHLQNGLEKKNSLEDNFKTDEDLVAEKIGKSFEKMLPPGILSFGPGMMRRECMTSTIVFNMPPDEYETMGRPTIGDTIVCQLTAMKMKALRGPT